MNRSERRQFRERAARHVMFGYGSDLEPHKVARILGLPKSFQVAPTGKTLFEECSIALARKTARAALKDLQSTGKCKVEGTGKKGIVTFTTIPSWLAPCAKGMSALVDLGVTVIQLLPFYITGAKSPTINVFERVFQEFDPILPHFAGPDELVRDLLAFVPFRRAVDRLVDRGDVRCEFQKLAEREFEVIYSLRIGKPPPAIPTSHIYIPTAAETKLIAELHGQRPSESPPNSNTKEDFLLQWGLMPPKILPSAPKAPAFCCVDPNDLCKSCAGASPPDAKREGKG